jgi:hypothetical protein
MGARWERRETRCVHAADRTILGSITVSHNELTEKMLKKYKKKPQNLI